MEKSKRIYWIDGLKGIACIMIFVHHFFVGFMPASYYGVGAMQHGNDGWEVLLSQNPASVLINGNFWVCVFCVLSGLVQGYKIFSMESLDRLPKGMVKRYFRLSLPVFFISMIVYLMMKGEMFYNVQANQIVQSPWLETYYLEKKRLKDVFYTSFISVWFVGDSTFSNAFWMLKEIFVGSYLTYILSMIGYKKRKNVLVIYAGLGIIFLILQSYMLAFVAGVIIAYIMANTEKKLKYQPTIGGIEILAGCFFGGYPTGVVPTNVYRLFSFQSYVIWHILGAFLVILGIYHCKIVQKILSMKNCLVLGENSFAIYLVHIPILFSFSSWAFVEIYERLNRYQLSVMLVLIMSLLAVLAGAYLYHNIIENICGKIEQKIIGKVYDK